MIEELLTRYNTILKEQRFNNPYISKEAWKKSIESKVSELKEIIKNKKEF